VGDDSIFRFYRIVSSLGDFCDLLLKKLLVRCGEDRFVDSGEERLERVRVNRSEDGEVGVILEPSNDLSEIGARERAQPVRTRSLIWIMRA